MIIITTGKKRYSRLSGGLCCCVSFWFWREIGSFFDVAGNFYYDRIKRYSLLSGGCAIIITTGKKKDTVVCLLGARFWRLRPKKKKDTVVCLAGCAVVLCQFLVLAGNWQFFCCGGKFSLRPEKKKVPVGVSIFGSGGKLAFFLLWQEIFITTGKKKFQFTTGKKRYSRLSGGCAINYD